MKFGIFDVDTVLFGTFRLDGGAMFGSVPKNLWSKKIPADADNCIALATRGLFIRFADHRVLVDLGNGDKWSDKLRKIFDFKSTAASDLPFNPNQITDVVLTHLHFDHAGGISHWEGDPRRAALSYPDAQHYLQKANYELAQAPSAREKASYLPENVSVLAKAKLQLTEGSQELFPDLWVHRIDGHTVGQQWIELRDGERSLLFPTDLIPTSHHVSLPYTMGYDMCAATVMKEKETFLNYAVKRDGILVFEHDLEVTSAKVGVDSFGQYCAVECSATLGR